MGATLSLTWFTPEWMYFGHIGDSRIYYLPAEGGLKQLTHDHTHVGWLRRKGQINEREARSHPMRNAIHQALGAGHQFIDPHLGAVGYKPGDRFLICSDGLVDGLWDRNLDEILHAPASTLQGQTVAQRLVEESVRISGRDNTTAVVIDVPVLPAAAP
jgi:protein phosphatase